MSGMVLTICPPTLFTFDNVLASNALTINLATRIDVSNYESGMLVVRQHSANYTNGTGTIAVSAIPHGYTPDDPGADFGGVGTALGTITLSQANTGTGVNYSTVALASSGSPFPNQLRIAITATKDATQGNALNAKLSIDLVLKTGAAAAAMAPRTPGCFQGYR